MSLTRQELIDYCLTFPDAFEDYPFDGETPFLRRRSNRMGFALFINVRGTECVNLKCHPDRAELYRLVYRDVTPGFHMNKAHWNTVRIGGDVPDDELLSMIAHSYELAAPPRRRPR